MSFIPFEVLDELNTSDQRFWSLMKSNDHFYKLNRAYNTIGRSLSIPVDTDSPVALFDRKELKKERLRLKDEIFDILDHD